MVMVIENGSFKQRVEQRKEQEQEQIVFRPRFWFDIVDKLADAYILCEKGLELPRVNNSYDDTWELELKILKNQIGGLGEEAMEWADKYAKRYKVDY